MTREEAIEIFKNMLDAWDNYYTIAQSDKKREAVELAISSLETDEAYQLEYEPTTKNDLEVDCIRRTSALDSINWAYNLSDAYQKINELPSVTPIRPKGHWIETAEEYYKAVNEKGGGVNENTDYFVDDIACSECLAKFSVVDNEAERFDFCPCCGSDNR